MNARRERPTTEKTTTETREPDGEDDDASRVGAGTEPNGNQRVKQIITPRREGTRGVRVSVSGLGWTCGCLFLTVYDSKITHTHVSRV